MHPEEDNDDGEGEGDTPQTEARRMKLKKHSIVEEETEIRAVPQHSLVSVSCFIGS